MGAKEAGGWLLSTSEQMGVKLPDMASIINAAPGEDPGRLAAMAQGIGGAFGIDPDAGRDADFHGTR